MDVALAVGGAFLSAFLQVAFDKIRSSRNFINFFQGKIHVKFDEHALDRLEITLDTIYVVLEDAEDKQAKSPAVKRWLSKLKDVVNQADDLLDEINTECLRLKLQYEYQPEKRKDYPNVSDMKLALNVDFIEELMLNVKMITDKLEYFIKLIHVLGLKKFDPKKKCLYRAQSSSVMGKSQIFGRDEERDKLIEMVLSDEEDRTSDVSVIAITGLGGIGKTTLAQLVYNDDRVKKEFSTTAWVCVSEEFDALRVTKALLMEIDCGVIDDKDDFNRLQVKLRDSVAGKRFLIVLDDIWTENYNNWHNLKNPLTHGGRGSKIVITTRNQKVALMMQNEPFHHMQPIPKEQSWSLFKSHAFDNGDHMIHTSFHEFETIGRAIVDKCQGLPLAIKTVAGALRQKRDLSEWHDILTSEIWTIMSGVLPALSLSYKHLPSHLKCCFAFCAIFPKDIPFEKDEVVLLWMANDLVQPLTHKSLEEIGRDYFDDLRSRSLFETVNEDKYLMHDLVNDLSQYVSGNFCARLQDYQDIDLHQRVRREIDLPREVLHFSYLSTYADTSRKFRALGEIHSLRTFLPIHGKPLKLTTLFFSDILPKFHHIRALTLSAYRISVIPDSIGDLKHLRLFNLASTKIKKLPNAISKCLNLQTLILKNCRNLEELPEDMRLLINLLHLDVRGVGDAMVEKMASLLSILKDTQNISIVVDKIHGSVLEELGKLQPCQLLEISGLENVVTVSSAKKIELKDKGRIENLSLMWSNIAECSKDELDGFAKLQPHTNTKQLCIKGYRGTSFSDWLGDSAFSNMVSVSLRDCKNCFFLPPLGQLSSLKKLHIYGLSKITEVGEEFYGNSSSSEPFQALEELSFCNMPEWVLWNTHLDKLKFSSLKEFCITDCPKLVGDIPFHLTCLKKFEITGLPSLHCNQEGSLSYSPSLQVAKISDLLSLKKIPQGINHLEELEVSRCPALVSIPNHVDKLMIRYCPSLSLSLQSSIIKQLVIVQCKHLEFPTSDNCNSCLRSLRIESCGYSIETIPLCSFSKLQDVYIDKWESPKLFTFPNEYHQTLTVLQSLKIYNCNNLLSFPEGGLPAPNLKEFRLAYCKKLKSLPEQMNSQLSSLSYFNIHRCPEIECFPEGGLPSSVETLYIVNCKKLMMCPRNWGLQRLHSLTNLCIGGIGDKLFPEEGLLHPSLRDLSIRECPNLETLNHKGLQHLTSLQSLFMGDCPNLKYFPEEMLFSSLSSLVINNCPQLKAQDWPKVSHIPHINMDYEVIS